MVTPARAPVRLRVLKYGRRGTRCRSPLLLKGDDLKIFPATVELVAVAVEHVELGADAHNFPVQQNAALALLLPGVSDQPLGVPLPHVAAVEREVASVDEKCVRLVFAVVACDIHLANSEPPRIKANAKTNPPVKIEATLTASSSARNTPARSPPSSRRSASDCGEHTANLAPAPTKLILPTIRHWHINEACSSLSRPAFPGA